MPSPDEITHMKEPNVKHKQKPQMVSGNDRIHATRSPFLLTITVFLWFIPKLQLQCENRDFPGGPVIDSMLPLQGLWVQSLVGELRSPHDVRWPKNLINKCKNIRGAGDPSCA